MRQAADSLRKADSKSCQIHQTASVELSWLPMSILDFMAAVSFNLSCFGLEYSLGKDTTQNSRPDLLG